MPDGRRAIQNRNGGEACANMPDTCIELRLFSVELLLKGAALPPS